MVLSSSQFSGLISPHYLAAFSMVHQFLLLHFLQMTCGISLSLASPPTLLTIPSEPSLQICSQLPISSSWRHLGLSPGFFYSLSWATFGSLLFYLHIQCFSLSCWLPSEYIQPLTMSHPLYHVISYLDYWNSLLNRPQASTLPPYSFISMQQPEWFY